MATKKLLRIQGKDADLNRAQSNISVMFDYVQNQLTGPVSIQTVTIENTGTVVSHKLGRRPVGWIIVDKTTNNDVWRTGDFSDLLVEFTSDGTVTLKILFF